MEKVELKVERLGNNGEGIAYLNKRPVYINYALIGEIVEVDIVENSRGHLEGKNLKVIVPSSIRTEPPCPYYYKCGGCNLQHMPYFETVKYKRNVINFLYKVNLRKETRRTKLNYTIRSEKEFRYRNRVILPVTTYDDKITFGLYYQDSNRFLPIDTCLIHKENTDHILTEIVALMTKHNIIPFNKKLKKDLLGLFKLELIIKKNFKLPLFLIRMLI